MKKRYFFVLLIFNYFLFAQQGFEFTGKKSKITIPIEFVNNLIIIPLELNGYKMNFLLDTGVEESILFSIEQHESVSFDKLKPIKLRGLGNGEPIDAYKSENNKIKIGKFYTDKNHTLSVILNQDINISPRVGFPINGIIGYYFFKNYPVEIDYLNKKIIIWRKDSLIKERLQKFNSLKINLKQNKPFLNVSAELENFSIKGDFLLDTGNSDAFWLFDIKKNIKFSSKYIHDFLGRGFNGEIYGKRTRLSKIYFQNIDLFIEKPIICIPDSASIRHVKNISERIGSIGSDFLKRNLIIWDYNNSKIYLKPNKWKNKAYEYNLSGIEVSQNGMEYKTEEIKFIDKRNNISQISNYSKSFNQLVLKPVFTISHVNTESEAYKMGLREGDRLLKVQNKNVSDLKLENILALINAENGKKIKITYSRNGEIFAISFVLNRKI